MYAVSTNREICKTQNPVMTATSSLKSALRNTVFERLFTLPISRKI